MSKIDLRENEFFTRFVGPDHVDSNDVQFWYQLLSCSFDFTRVSDPKNVDKTLSPYIDLLALNNSQSLNFGSLIRVAIDRVSRIKPKGNTSTNPYYIFQSFNALYLIKTICKNFIEKSSEEMLLQAFRAKVDVQPQATPHKIPAAPKDLQKQVPSASPPIQNGQAPVVPPSFDVTNEKQPVDTELPELKPVGADQATKSSDAATEPKVAITAGATMMDQFISILIEIIVDIPLNDSTYLLQVEAVNSLLVLLSIQMYSNHRADQFYVFKTLMHKKCSIHALMLTKTLLNNFIRQDQLPHEHGSIILGLASGLWKVLTLGYGQDEDEEDTIAYLARQSLLLLNVLTNHCTGGKNPYREAIIHCQDVRFNPSDPLMAQHISDNDALATASTSQSVLASNNIKVDFLELFNTICRHLHNDQVALLLYFLLHNNKIFKPFILTTAAPMLDQLLLPLLKILYTSIQKGSHHIYMVLIIFVILSEESSFNSTLNKSTLKGISWFKDRVINEISLGSFTTLIIIRSFQYNTFRVRDKFLHTNLFATLGNLSNYTENLHPYVCQRLLDLLERLTRRYLTMTKPHAILPQIPTQSPPEMFDLNNPLARALATDTLKQDLTQDCSQNELNSQPTTLAHIKLNQEKDPVPSIININIPDSDQTQKHESIQNNSLVSTSTEVTDREALIANHQITGQQSPSNSSQQSDHINISMDDSKMELEWIEEIIRMLLEVTRNILDSQLQSNSNLVYTLLYKRNVFSSLLSSSQSLYNLVISVERVLTFFYDRIENEQRQLTVEEIKGLIEVSSGEWISSQIPGEQDTPLLFRYVEDEQPEDFFIPYMWTKIYYSSGISWNPKRIVLFNPEVV